MRFSSHFDIACKYRARQFDLPNCHIRLNVHISPVTRLDGVARFESKKSFKSILDDFRFFPVFFAKFWILLWTISIVKPYSIYSSKLFTFSGFNVMQVITLNIGLLNNPFSHGKATAYKSLFTAFDDIINVVRFQFPGESVIESRYEHGTYNGESEPTLVVRIKTDDELTSTQVKTICRNLCQFFTQECIPFTSVRDCGEYFQAFYNGLIYHRDYDGKKYDFDPAFFINY